MVPSRVFVGITVFGLLATVLIVPYTFLVFTGLNPAAISPILSFDGADDPGFRVFLVLASGMAIGLTVFAWRGLLAGARRDAKRREARADVVREQRRYKRRPPGHT